MSRYRRNLPLQSAALAFAEDKVGLGESEGENWGPLVAFCLKLAGFNRAAPWCAAFANAMAEEAAAAQNRWSPLEDVPQQALVQSYVDHGRENGWVVGARNEIAPGDLVCFSTGRTDREYDHLGFVRAEGDVPDASFRSVEANTAPDVEAGSARDRDGEIVDFKVRRFDNMSPLFLAWGRSL